MTYLTKPKFHHPGLPKNALGYTHRDYEGSISTLCAGCGHDSITRRHHRGLFRAFGRAAQGGEDFRHRLLVEDADLFFSAIRTASTRCMAACRRSSPAPISPTAT